MLNPIPRYLRIQITERCGLKCNYCHREGADVKPKSDMVPEDLGRWLNLLSEMLLGKIKLLGGEAFLHPHLISILCKIRDVFPTTDLSVVTNGCVPLEVVKAALSNGLDRINLSLHGFTLEEAAVRSGTSNRQFHQRMRVLDYLLAHSYNPKLNYVYRGERDFSDLHELLHWARSNNATMNPLDDLNGHLTPEDMKAVVKRILGRPDEIVVAPDPYSLPTEHLHYGKMIVEIKHERLGKFAPYHMCKSCSQRKICREGIHAARLTPDGLLVPCMLRRDQAFDMKKVENPEDVLTWWEAI